MIVIVKDQRKVNKAVQEVVETQRALQVQQAQQKKYDDLIKKYRSND